jgi:hypothetical protein
VNPIEGGNKHQGKVWILKTKCVALFKFYIAERDILKHNIVYESSNFFYSSNVYDDYEKYLDELIIFKELILPKYL